MPEFEFDNRRGISKGWNESRLFLGKPLSDRKIAEYQRRGYYASGFKLSRRDQAKKDREWLLKNGI